MMRFGLPRVDIANGLENSPPSENGSGVACMVVRAHEYSRQVEHCRDDVGFMLKLPTLTAQRG